MERTIPILQRASTKKRLVTIKRYERCFGLSFINIGKWKLEFWFVPANYQLKPHFHKHVNIRFYLLFAHRVSFFRKRPSDNSYKRFDAKWFNMFRRFNIRAGDVHWPSVSTYPVIHMNIEEWLIEPSSVSEDFHLEEKESNAQL